MNRIALLAVLLIVAGCAGTKKSAPREPEPRIPGYPEPDQIFPTCQTHMDKAKKILDGMLAMDKGSDDLLDAYNDLWIEIDAAWRIAAVTSNLHPEKEVRDKADKFEQEINEFYTNLNLNRDVYDAFAAIDVSRHEPLEQRLVKKILRDFRRSGVNKDEETRNRIKALQDDILKAGQDFGRNIREDVRSIELESIEELEGCPPDFIKSRKPNDDGKIVITTNYPDLVPVIRYAKSEDVRRRIAFEFKNRAYPKNEPVLKALISKRHELANLLGYPTWAAYITENKMVGTPEKALEFIEKIATMSKDRAARDYAELLELKREDVPDATVVNSWESSYYSNKVRQAKYSFDAQSVRPYFEFNRVKKGIMDLMAEIFGTRFERVTDVQKWHESVDVYQVTSADDGSLIGHAYLDLHPRDGKYKHAAHLGLYSGVKGKQVPVGMLMCNFPDPGASEGPALMSHGQVSTFFHEFGHLMHHLLGGHQKWIEFAGVSTERDFVEAPSQLLEEWIWDADVLQRFAKHHETGEAIPTDLVRKMKKADAFARGINMRRQMALAMMSLTYYSKNPEDLDLLAEMIKIDKTLSPYPYQKDTHWHLSFGHLDGYSATYYTYAWSEVISKDLFTRFKKEGILNPAVSSAYRKAVLEPGGSKDAADLVEDFLGRPYSFDAFRDWFEGGE